MRDATSVGPQDRRSRDTPRDSRQPQGRTTRRHNRSLAFVMGRGVPGRLSRRARTGLAALLGVSVFLLVVPAALGAPPSPASGSFSGTTSVVHLRTADGITFLTLAATRTLTGDFVGVLVSQDFVSIRSDGSLTEHASGTFTGTVRGSAVGTATFVYEGSGSAVTGAITLAATVLNGNGGLDGLHAEGLVDVQLTGPSSFVGTYSLSVQFSLSGATG